jgi:hypothetical protein
MPRVVPEYSTTPHPYQLYFDRRRALVSLAAYADRNDPEAVALESRCRMAANRANEKK